MRARPTSLLTLILLACAGQTEEATGPDAPEGEAIALVVSPEVIGRTPESIGVVEGGTFDLATMIDLGVTSYRIYLEQERVEPTDDDGIPGSPSIDAIKADPGIVPWTVWDASLAVDAYWQGAGMDRILSDSMAAGIEPLICLIPRDRVAPVTEGEKNEWWQFCFAMAYWCNVRSSLALGRWQVMNEPSLELDGSEQDYLEMVRLASDAIRFANGLAGVPTHLHSAADIPGGEGRGMLGEVLRVHDDIVDVADYHNFTRDFHERDAADWVHALMLEPGRNPDGNVEPLWVSEIGTYDGSYDDRRVALDLADSVYALSTLEETVDPTAYCQGMNVFVLNDWGPWDGLVSARGDRKESYYALRLMIRALQGGREKLAFTAGDPSARIVVTREENIVYVAALEVGSALRITLDSLGVTSGTADVYEYSPSARDEKVQTLPVTDGVVEVDAPASGIVCVEIRI